MAEKDKEFTLSAAQLQQILEGALKAATAPNALEQKRLDEEIERERRRSILSVQLAKIEEDARWRRQNSCSHSCDSKTGASVRRGTGNWTTSGQMHGDDSCSVICQRCATLWHFSPTKDEREYILNGPGLLGFAPPAIDRCLNRDDFAVRPAPAEGVMGLTMAQGRAAVVHLRDGLGLSNRELARVFQDSIEADSFVNFMNGDDSAITSEQSNIVGNEIARYISAEDEDNEQLKRMGFKPKPGFREVLGFTK